MKVCFIANNGKILWTADLPSAPRVGENVSIGDGEDFDEYDVADVGWSFSRASAPQFEVLVRLVPYHER